MKPHGRPSKFELSLSLAVLLLFASTAAATKLNKYEKIVLLDLKRGLTGLATQGWSSSLRNCSQFKGVTCNKMGRITELALPRQSLSGSLRPSIGNLTYLTLLDLKKNKISGGIPWTIIKCKILSKLDLSYNQFSGEIPARIDVLNQLFVLHLEFNTLSSKIPAKIGDVTNLQILDLSNNKLSGMIPTSISNLKKLQYVYLNGNRLTGPLPVIDSQGLFIINLSRNFLSGPLHLSFASQYVVSVDVSSNFLLGPVTVTQGGERFCPVAGNGWSGIRKNCIGAKEYPGGCQRAQQRTEKECEGFCGLGQKGGACGGKGVCTQGKGGGFYCECQKGYRVGKGKGKGTGTGTGTGSWTCVKSGTK